MLQFSGKDMWSVSYSAITNNASVDICMHFPFGSMWELFWVYIQDLCHWSCRICTHLLHWKLSEDSPGRLYQFTCSPAVLEGFYLPPSSVFSDFWIFTNLMAIECYLPFHLYFSDMRLTIFSCFILAIRILPSGALLWHSRLMIQCHHCSCSGCYCGAGQGTSA